MPGCLHSFCFNCLLAYSKGEKAFPCPSCKTPVNLGDGTLEKLAANPYYNIIMDSSGSGVESDVGGNTNNHHLRQPICSSMNGGKVNRHQARQHHNGGQQTNSLDFQTKIPNSGNLQDSQSAAWTPSKELQSDPAWKIGSIWNNRTPLFGPDDSGWKPLGNNGVAENGNSPWISVIGTPTPSSAAPGGSNANTAFGFPLTEQTRMSGGGDGGGAGGGGHCQAQQQQLCISCGEKQEVTSRCLDCSEDLCNACVVAHQRVKLTRGHRIVAVAVAAVGEVTKMGARMAIVDSHANLPGIMAPSALGSGGGGSGGNNGGGNNSSLSALNPPLVVPPSANVQSADVMRVYSDAVDKAKVDSEKLIIKAKQSVGTVAETKAKVADMEKMVIAKANVVIKDINTNTERNIQVLKEREAFMLRRLETIRRIKMETLKLQQKNLSDADGRLRFIAEELSSCKSSGLVLIDACKKAEANLMEVHSKCGPLSVHEDDIYEFTGPQPIAMEALSNVGFVAGSAFAPASQAEGDGTKKAILGKDAR